jgi:hypothetical protein
MLVPLSVPQVPCDAGSDDITPTPGADTSGFIASDTGVGPADEKSATVSVDVTAATLIASAALPGEDTEP